MLGKCVHHVPEHLFTMCPVYTPAPARGAGEEREARERAKWAWFPGGLSC